MTGSKVDFEEGFELELPGKSCLREAFADMIMLYVMSAAEKAIIRVKKTFPQPISSTLWIDWYPDPERNKGEDEYERKRVGNFVLII